MRKLLSRDFILTIYPRILTILSLLILTLKILFPTEVAEDNKLFLFFSSFASAAFLVLYLFVKNKKTRYAPEVFVLFFYVFTVYLYLFSFPSDKYTISHLAYLIFIQHLLFRLIERLLTEGFPVFTFLFNYIALYLIMNNFNTTWIPFFYAAIQTIENYLNLKYSFFKNLIRGDMYEILIYLSVYLFYIIQSLQVLYIVLAILALLIGMQILVAYLNKSSKHK